jgi:hypothetical protein
MPFRHCSRGFSVTVVFTMPIGELSVAVVPGPRAETPRPLPGSGAARGPDSEHARRFVTDMPGGEVGM